MITIPQLHTLFEQCTGVTTDSRTITKGSMFFALKGASFDGNLYATDALQAGALYAIIDNPDKATDSRCIVVDNVLNTLQALATHHRQQYNIPVLAITGTNGKTTTKELVAAVLACSYRTTVTQGNLNNHIGVPLTLLRLNNTSQIAVVEMGANHPGEIAQLCHIAQPTHGLITNIGKAHLEGFGSFEGVKQTKGELIAYLATHQGTFFFNTDSPEVSEMVAHHAMQQCISYGMHLNHTTLLLAHSQQPYLHVHTQYGDIHTSLVGTYNTTNILAALAVGHYFDIDPRSMIQAIEQYSPSNHRSQLIQTSHNHVLMDAYNANPSSMQAALQNFALLPISTKIAILGGMRELGSDSANEHAALVALVAPMGFEQILLVGKEFAQSAPDNHHYLWFAHTDQLVQHLKNNPIVGAYILVKGSRGLQLEKTLEVL